VKSFEPGAFPGHCYAVRELEFAATHLIRTLSGIVSAQPVFANALKQLGAFFATISDPAACMLSVHDYVQRVDAKLAGLLDAYRGISRAFEQREHEIKFGASGSTMAAETLALARDTNARVKRIDARGRPNVAAKVPEFAKIPPDRFFPCIDRYGQFKWSDWPGKVKDDADLAAAKAAEDADLAAHPGPAGRDKWGSWAEGPRLESTGHFRVQKKVRGKWWFVDPGAGGSVGNILRVPLKRNSTRG